MEIYFNELSIKPTSTTLDASRQKVMELLNVMKLLKEYDVTALRTFEGFYAEDLGCNYTFSSFLTDEIVKRDLKILLQSIIKNPTIPDLDSYEAEMFINNKYDTLNHIAQYEAPEGIAISFINSVPTLSLTDFPYWQNSILQLRVYTQSDNEPTIEEILNISSLQSLQSNEFREWIESITVGINLNSHENILLEFPEDLYEFDTRAINDIISWYYDDKRFLVRIKQLIEDIKANPFLGGKGKTEVLGNGRASKRIIKKDRIIYTYTQNKIFIHQCRGHYNDN
jgi:toxin YoeB